MIKKATNGAKNCKPEEKMLLTGNGKNPIQPQRLHVNNSALPLKL
jgi:hypothetical protein